MKNLIITLFLAFAIGNVQAQKRKVITYQLMRSGFNTKFIFGTISEVYSTKRYGETFWWVKIGQDTIIHVWDKDLDTTTMKMGVTKKFYSIRRLDGDLWKKEKSEISPLK